MDYLKQYENWMQKADEETIKDLMKIKKDDKEIEDRFYQILEFGTGGLRGVMAAGTNRMNKYVIGQVTKALAQVIVERKRQKDGVVIAYDCRINSKKFAKHCACIFAGHGIKTYIFEDLRPTPVLSFAVRYLRTVSGINVTASHNPKEYNGYKVYWEEGSQILDDMAFEIQNKIRKIDVFDESNIIDFREGVKTGIIQIVGKEVDDEYTREVLALTINDSDVDKNIKIIYTPFNGAGIVFVPDILRARGFEKVEIVKEQMHPDGNFPTIPSPNPENTENFEYALKYAKRSDADLVLASDPDADRIAIMVKDNENKFIALNGNQTGVLLINYILSQRKKRNMNKKNDVLVKTIVTGDMCIPIAKKYGVKTIETLTGFKYICGLANEFERTKEYNFVFGYEESIGYCPETFSRDKDAVSSAMLIAEMCGYYKAMGKTLYQVLFELFEQYGHYRETQFSIFYRGIEGAKIKGGVMKRYRNNYPQTINGTQMAEAIDYLRDGTGLPKSNVLKFRFEDRSWYAVRPSGTEPKLKVYIYTVDNSEEESLGKLKKYEKEIREHLQIIEKQI